MSSLPSASLPSPLLFCFFLPLLFHWFRLAASWFEGLSLLSFAGVLHTSSDHLIVLIVVAPFPPLLEIPLHINLSRKAAGIHLLCSHLWLQAY